LAAQQPERLDPYGDPLPHAVIARLGSTRLRAVDDVQQLAWSPDGKLLASTCRRGVQVWDAASGKDLWSDTVRPRTLAFSQDSKLLLASYQAAISVRRATDGAAIGWSESQGSAVLCPHPSENYVALVIGKTVVAMSYSTESRSGRETSIRRVDLGQLEIQGQPTVAWSSRGDVVAVGSEGEGERVWLLDATNPGRCRLDFAVKGRIHGLLFSPDDQALAVITDKEISWVDAATGKTMLQFTPAVKQPTSWWLSPDGKELAVAGSHEPGIARIWDTQTGKLLHTFEHGQSISVTAFSPDGKTLALSHWKQRIDLWNVRTGKPALVFEGHDEPVRHLSFLADGKSVATTTNDGAVRVWETETGKLRHQFRHTDLDLYAARQCFAAGGTLLMTHEADKLCVWDVATGKVRRIAAPTGQKPWELRDACASGKTLVLRTLEEVLVWDIAADKPRRMPVPRATIATLSPDQSKLLTVTEKEIAIWDLVTCKAFWQRNRDPNEYFLSWTPDSRQILMQHSLPFLFAIDAVTGKRSRSLSGDDALDYLCGAYSPDGAHLATISYDGKLTLWETVTMQPVVRHVHVHTIPEGTFRDAPQQLFALTFDATGRRLAVSVADTSVLVYDLPRLAKLEGMAKLDEAEAWAALTGDSARAAFHAQCELVQRPGDALAWCKKRLKAVPVVADEQLQKLLDDLDARQFARREAAAKELLRLDDVAEEALRKLIEKPPTLEVRRRAEVLVAAMEQRFTKYPSPKLGMERAVQILEHIGSVEARETLKSLSAGDSRARLTRQAQAALGRLAEPHQ
jgi:WD40 repeat protein